MNNQPIHVNSQMAKAAAGSQFLGGAKQKEMKKEDDETQKALDLLVETLETFEDSQQSTQSFNQETLA